MNQKTTIIAIVCLILIGIGGYIVFAHVNAPSVPSPVATSTEQGTTDAVTSTTTTTTTTTTHPAPTPTPTPPTPKPHSGMITPDDNGKTVVLAQGQRFGIAMGDSLDWSLAFDPEGVVTRVTNIATIRGEQGVYTATKVGTTVLHATGAPMCNPGEACPQFRQSVTVTLVVK